MSTYELALVIDAGLEQSQVDSILKSIEQQIKKAGGETTRSESWGKKQLAYQINRVSEGVYFILQLSFPDSQAVKQLENHLRLREDLLRYLLIKRSLPSTPKTASAATKHKPRPKVTKPSTHKSKPDKSTKDKKE
jgi:small subunit ribosomal protein S6